MSTSVASSDLDLGPQNEARVVLYFLFTIGQFVLLSFTILRLGGLPPWLTPAPYLLLVAITFFLFIGYLFMAFYIQFNRSIPRQAQLDIQLVFSVLFDIDIALRPGIVLYLIHIRGSIWQSSQPSRPFAMSQLWKKIVDWVVVALTLIPLVTSSGYNFKNPSRSSTRTNLIEVSGAFSILSHVLVMLSTIIMSIQIKSRKLTDPVITGLLVVIPFCVLWIGGTTISVLLPRFNVSTTLKSMNLAVSVCQGVARIGISAVLIWTMKQPVWREKSPAPHNTLGIQPGRPLSTPNQHMVSGHVNEQLASHLDPRQSRYSVTHHITYSNTNQHANNLNQ